MTADKKQKPLSMFGRNVICELNTINLTKIDTWQFVLIANLKL